MTVFSGFVDAWSHPRCIRRSAISRGCARTHSYSSQQRLKRATVVVTVIVTMVRRYGRPDRHYCLRRAAGTSCFLNLFEPA